MPNVVNDERNQHASKRSRTVWRRDRWSVLLLTASLLSLGVCRGSERQTPVDHKTQNVLLITIDGLRWQELFGGADDTLINKEFGGVRAPDSVKEEFGETTPEKRREKLMPFFWRVVARQGRVYGDPVHDSVARVTNKHLFSYPGYNELLTGRPDPRIDSNEKRGNPNVTVLEWLHRRKGFEGKVHALASWDVFPFIINTERSGIPVNAGWHPLADVDPALSSLDVLSNEVPRYWDNVRYDYFTFRGALTCLTRHQPRVLYVALGETDDWAHARRYDLYLDAARRTDQYLERLWNAAQQLPQYKGRTSLIITTDHGRGDARLNWIDHGAKVPEADRIWMAVLGPDTKHSKCSGTRVTQGQVAATVAALLGLDFHRASPTSAPPLPGILSE